MSYILEALKKAQAERQLGHSPTIHAPTLQSGAQAAAASRLKQPVVLVVGAMAVVIAVLVALILRPAAPVAVPAVAVASKAPVATATLAPAPVQEQEQALPEPVAALPPPVANVAPSAPRTEAAAAPALTTAAKVEEPVLNLRELPEPIQRAIPQVAVGGYIYSKNPADRLLLVDKILRREGEEVAPGLLLEKLHPKEAVFSYKGYRYRVPY
jgi:general secretion pathway protein B